jgi:hypothetical protein
VQYWETREGRVRGADPAFEQTFANRREAEQALIRLINTGQFAQAPVERELPEGYNRTEGLRGQFIEIGMPEDDPDAANKPYGFVQKMGNMWQEKYYNTLQSYLDGNEPDNQGVHTDKNEALNSLIDQINARIEETRGRRPGELPQGFVVENVASGNNAFEVKHEDEPNTHPFALIEKNADGKWVASKWATGQAAADARYRRPQSEETFDTREEAQAWAADQMADPLAEFADLVIHERDLAVIAADGGVISPRLRAAFQMRRLFEQGYTVANSRAGGSNGTIQVRLSDGTTAFLKTGSAAWGAGDVGDVEREIAGARMFEAVGLSRDLVICEVIDPRTNQRAVLFKDVGGEAGRNLNRPRDAQGFENAREIALVDLLMDGVDRHGGNWHYENGVAIPIDNGYSHNTRDPQRGDRTRINLTLDKIANADSERNGQLRGAFHPLIQKWVRGENQLFTASEFESIAEKVTGLRAMYEAMGPNMLEYFDNFIMKRLNVLLGHARSQ